MTVKKLVEMSSTLGSALCVGMFAAAMFILPIKSAFVIFFLLSAIIVQLIFVPKFRIYR